MKEELFQSADQMSIANNYNNWLFEQLSTYLKGEVLEVGCGVGTFTCLLDDYPYCDTIDSIDISESAINHVRQTYSFKKVNLRKADISSVEKKYDCIICMNVMEHIENDSFFFQNLINRLKKNGVLFLLVPSHKFLYSDFDREGGHYRRYSKKDIIKWIYNGINLKEQYYFNFIGALGYYVVYKLLKKIPDSDASSEIGFFDTYIVPFSRKFLPKKMPIGISLISVIVKN